MFALDTNVLVRYIAQDDRRQAALAVRFIENELSAESRGYVSLVALLETVWVMESRYEADRPTVAGILNDLLDTACLEVQDAESVRDATAHYRDGGVDLHDALIASLAGKRGAQVVTFDKKAARKLGMTVLK